MIVVESADEVSALPKEDLKNLKLVLLHVGEQDAGSSEVRADLAEIEATLNGTPTVLFGQRSEPSQVVSAIRAGARGYISAATPGGDRQARAASGRGRRSVRSAFPLWRDQ